MAGKQGVSCFAGHLLLHATLMQRLLMCVPLHHKDCLYGLQHRLLMRAASIERVRRVAVLLGLLGSAAAVVH